MPVGQAADNVQQRGGFMDHFDGAVGVHSQVIPGGHHLGVVGLAGVVAGADISIGAWKDQQRFAATLQVLPLAIGACQMGIDGTEFAFLWVDQHRQVRSQQAVLALADQHGQAGFKHVLVQAPEVVFLVGFAVVHTGVPCPMAPS